MSFERIKYESALITFTEVPDEITLCLNITGCPCHCRDCFEPWLAEDTGTELKWAVLEALIDKHKHISCICFMGGDRYADQIVELAEQIKIHYPALKIAMYSGIQNRLPQLEKVLDYYKVGPFIPECGPMNVLTTNQHFWEKTQNGWIDTTYKFQKRKL